MPGATCVVQPAQSRPARVQQRGQGPVPQRPSTTPQIPLTSRRAWLAGLAGVAAAVVVSRPAAATGLESIDLPAGKSGVNSVTQSKGNKMCLYIILRCWHEGAVTAFLLWVVGQRLELPAALPSFAPCCCHPTGLPDHGTKHLGCRSIRGVLCPGTFLAVPWACLFPTHPYVPTHLPPTASPIPCSGHT